MFIMFTSGEGLVIFPSLDRHWAAMARFCVEKSKDCPKMCIINSKMLASRLGTAISAMGCGTGGTPALCWAHVLCMLKKNRISMVNP